jgi:hypothetical protein
MGGNGSQTNSNNAYIRGPKKNLENLRQPAFDVSEIQEEMPLTSSQVRQ